LKKNNQKKNSLGPSGPDNVGQTTKAPGPGDFFGEGGGAGRKQRNLGVAKPKNRSQPRANGGGGTQCSGNEASKKKEKIISRGLVLEKKKKKRGLTRGRKARGGLWGKIKKLCAGQTNEGLGVFSKKAARGRKLMAGTK